MLIIIFFISYIHYSFFNSFFGQDDVHAIACCTGKSVSNFGIEGARESQAYGLVFCMKYLLENEEFCKKNKIEAGLKGKTFTVQVNFFFTGLI